MQALNCGHVRNSKEREPHWGPAQASEGLLTFFSRRCGQNCQRGVRGTKASSEVGVPRDGTIGVFHAKSA